MKKYYMRQRIYIHLAIYNNFYLFTVGFLFNISTSFIFAEDFDIKTMQEQWDHYNIEYENRLDIWDINNTTKPTAQEEWDHYNFEFKNRIESIISIERPPVPYTDDFSLVHEGTVWRETEFNARRHIFRLYHTFMDRVTNLPPPDKYRFENYKEIALNLIKNDPLFDVWKSKTEAEYSDTESLINQMNSYLYQRSLLNVLLRAHLLVSIHLLNIASLRNIPDEELAPLYWESYRYLWSQHDYFHLGGFDFVVEEEP